jgi:hypothetical protein
MRAFKSSTAHDEMNSEKNTDSKQTKPSCSIIRHDTKQRQYTSYKGTLESWNRHHFVEKDFFFKKKLKISHKP